MPLFVIIGHDIPNSSEQRAKTRPEHLQRLNALDAQNRLVVAGPMPTEHGKPEMTGSLIIAHFDDIEQAKEWVADEPYLRDGVYSHVDIRPFVQALPVETSA